MKNILRRHRRRLVYLCLAVIAIVYCVFQNDWIELETIQIQIDHLPMALKGLRIVQISDVHLPKNASTIHTILMKVKQQKPDMIVITGDLIDKNADIETCGLDEFCHGLSDIAATYAVTGNHEFLNGHVAQWKRILAEHHIEVMDNRFILYTKDGQSIAIEGLRDSAKYKPDTTKGHELVKDGMPHILLSHKPERISTYASDANSLQPDVVFCGHAHGGQWRLPFWDQGLYSPNQGVFPHYTSGLYRFGDVQMVVSRGLSNSVPIRINNRPHIPVIELIGAD